MTDPMEHVRILAGEIGPRASTGRAERFAAEYATGVLRKLGLQVAVESFRSPASWTAQNAIAFGLVLAAVPLYLASPLAAFLLALAGLLLGVLENDTWHLATRLMPQRPSQNVVGRLLPSGQVRRRLVLAAHLDTSRSDYAHHPSRVAGFRTTYLLNVAACAWVALCFGVGALLVGREWSGEVVAGANDNASGVAAVLSAVGQLQAAPLAETEVWAVLTGCEEVVANGMVDFLRRHGPALRDAFFLVPDNCGAGQAQATTLEGMLIPRRSSGRLLAWARQAATQEPPLPMGFGPYRAGYTDATAALARGYQALSVLALDEQGVLPNWHWPTDTMENVQPQTVQTVTEFLVRMARQVDAA
ncbi:MAG: Zn-dependent exopeptidase M28 [Chloroflexi bacterium]|nr:Zn-dependent exopeptidase M28 [Chloroflexota bacterium]